MASDLPADPPDPSDPPSLAPDSSSPTPTNSPLAPGSVVNGGSVGSGADNAPLVAPRSASGEKVGKAGGWGARDAAAARIAAGEKTLVTTQELIACGLGRDAVAYRLGAGRLHLVFRGVYSFGCGELPALARELAALKACGERSFVSHGSAAFVWGLLPQPPVAVVEVTVVGRGCRSREGLRVHRIHDVDRREVRRHEGVWVSSPARLCLEIAATSPAELPEVIDAGLANRILNRRELEAMLNRHRGDRGIARLAAILGDASAMAITRSRAEKAMLRLIRDSGLPMPEVNVSLGPYRPDFMWRSHRLIVELDSYGFHGGPGRFQNDRDKDLFYRGAAFDVLRLTRAHVVYEPAFVLVTVAKALAVREPS
jgi:very-short-patch-repair endonuclease